jgi:hypothetical protein
MQRRDKYLIPLPIAIGTLLPGEKGCKNNIFSTLNLYPLERKNPGQRLELRRV